MPNQTELAGITRLLRLHKRPFLAIKAYASFLRRLKKEEAEGRSSSRANNNNNTNTSSSSTKNSKALTTLYYQYLYDFILHCNAFAIAEHVSDRESASARDYYRCAMEELAHSEGFEWSEDAVDEAAAGAAGGNSLLTDLGLNFLSAVVAESRGEEDSSVVGMSEATLSLLSLTLANWGCLELVVRRVGKGLALLHLSDVVASFSSPSSPSRTASSSTTTQGHYVINAVRAINESVREITLCNFPEAQQCARSCIPALLEVFGKLMDPTSSSRASSTRAEELNEVSLLRGAAYYAYGVAEEHEQCERAVDSVSDAVEQLTHCAQASPANSSVHDVVLATHTRMAEFLHAAKRELAAAQQAEEQAFRDQRKGRRGGPAKKAGSVSKKLRSITSERSVALMTPPITAALRTNIKRHGLELVLGAALDMRNAARILRHQDGKGDDEEEDDDDDVTSGELRSSSNTHNFFVFVSPFQKYNKADHEADDADANNNGDVEDDNEATKGETQETDASLAEKKQGYTMTMRVASFLVCAETPTSLALEVERAAKGSTVRNSVWSIRKALPWYLLPAPEATAAGEEGTMTSAAAASPTGDTGGGETATNVSEHSSALKPTKPKPVLKALMPPMMPQSAIDNAQKGSNTVTKLLTQRLNVLLKSEKAFSDRWTATERIKSALVAYAVPQEMLRLKESLIAKKRLDSILAERSARILVRFFRRVVAEKPRLTGFVNAEERRQMRDNNAAIVLQKYARRWIVISERKRREEEVKKKLRKITVVQSIFRMKHAKRHVINLLDTKRREDFIWKLRQSREHAATEIQRVFRGHYTRQQLLRQGGQHHAAMLMHLHDSRHYHATQIQKRVRGMLIRRQYGRAVLARRRYGRNVYRSARENASCLTIQRIYRGWRARRRYGPVIRARCLAIAAAEEAEEAAAAEMLRLTEERVLFEAAAKIQSVVRGNMAKSHVQQLRGQCEPSPADARAGETYKPFNVDEWEY